MTEATVGREPVQIVEIVQPFCANTYGIAPCTASGGADVKCYNTYATCQDQANYDGGTLSLYFAKGMVAEAGVEGAPYIIPSLVSASTTPTKINLAGADSNSQGIGTRAVCRLVFQDHAHSDRRVDPYVDGRSWTPLSRDRGSFWSRWLVRNKYRQNIVLKVYDGYAGQALADMRSRTYFLQEVSGPDSSGRVTIIGKDILTKLEFRKAQAPEASPGVLYTTIEADDTTFEVANAFEDDYPASGTLRIGSECMTYTGRATSDNGIEFTGVTRGTDNTEAAKHDTDAAVQICLRYTNARIDDVLFDMLTEYGGIDESYLNTAGWEAEVDLYKNFYRLNTLITEPTSVQSLVSEIQVQTMTYIWWDERDATVQIKAIRGIEEEPDTLTAEHHILEGSFSLTEQPSQRASQVWLYYQRRDPTDSKTDATNYESQFVVADLNSETDKEYGEASIRTIYCNWITSDVLVQTTGSVIITRYVEVPSQVSFRLDAKDRKYWVGDNVYISHYLDVDQYGARRIRQWTITSAEEKIPGEVVEYVAEDTTLYGKIHYVMANGTADYPGESAPFKNCYIGNSDGLLSDGTSCGRVG